jgi:SPP1 gp7 family putative phage head morphogenesis protein
LPKKPPTPKQLRRVARERFLKVRRAGSAFERQLTSVSRQVGSIVEGFAESPVTSMAALRAALLRYAEFIRPWARAVTMQMHKRVAKRDLVSWVELGRTMGQELRKEIMYAPTGKAMREALAEQVNLITSLPIEAAERVHKLTTAGIIEGTRASEIEKEILETGHVTLSRARLIARTEVARTASLLVESRARFVGSEGYTWRTSLDERVRPEHRKLEGKFIMWDDPPVAGPNGMRYHAGQGPACRCYCEPLLPDKIQ